MNDSKQTAAVCPLCGGDNHCAIAAGQSVETCWCLTVTISAEARAEAADFATSQCLCEACGRPAGESDSEW